MMLSLFPVTLCTCKICSFQKSKYSLWCRFFLLLCVLVNLQGPELLRQGQPGDKEGVLRDCSRRRQGGEPRGRSASCQEQLPGVLILRG